MKQISLLGSTGSIGSQTLDVIERHQDKLSIRALAAGKSKLDVLVNQVKKFRPEFVAVPDQETANNLLARIPEYAEKIGTGAEALEKAASIPEATHVVVAVVGSLGLLPTLRALNAGKVVALANKETLVAGGHLVNESLKTKGGTLIPIDSEHSAIFQCLRGENRTEVAKIWLTASGGPFRGFTSERLEKVTKEQVLHHPVWRMGNKITVDSATLMNKGLEVIEAKWLFGIEPDRIQVLVHPQGIIHSMIEMIDGSVMAQLGLPDMRTPIQIALSFPERWHSPLPKLDLAEIGTLAFEKPDMETFPCLKYAFEAARKGGILPAALNAANEAAVQLFLDDQIRFAEIPEMVDAAIRNAERENKEFPTLEEVLEADLNARKYVRENAPSKKIGAFGG